MDEVGCNHLIHMVLEAVQVDPDTPLGQPLDVREHLGCTNGAGDGIDGQVGDPGNVMAHHHSAPRLEKTSSHPASTVGSPYGPSAATWPSQPSTLRSP